MRLFQIHNHPVLKDNRKALRNNATPEEELLWKYLKRKQTGFKFRRQHSIENCIVDFYCAELRVAVEIDGAHHFTAEGRKNDKDRDNFLNEFNIRVLRFSNSKVTGDVQKVVSDIVKFLQGLSA